MENEREILLAELEKLAEKLTYEQLRSVYIFTLQKNKISGNKPDTEITPYRACSVYRQVFGTLRRAPSTLRQWSRP